MSSDFAFDTFTPAYKSLLEISQRIIMIKDAEGPAEEIEKITATFGRQIAVIPPQEIESIIASSGFDTPVLSFQTLLIHAWFSKRAAFIGTQA